MGSQGFEPRSWDFSCLSTPIDHHRYASVCALSSKTTGVPDDARLHHNPIVCIVSYQDFNEKLGLYKGMYKVVYKFYDSFFSMMEDLTKIFSRKMINTIYF